MAEPPSPSDQPGLDPDEVRAVLGKLFALAFELGEEIAPEDDRDERLADVAEEFARLLDQVPDGPASPRALSGKNAREAMRDVLRDVLEERRRRE